MSHLSIELNCDLGEARDSLGFEQERQLLPLIQRCNIACGGHAGNAATMRETLQAAIEANVICGAHPGYPDRKNFGRRSLDMDFDKLSVTLYHQICSLQSEARKIGVQLAHIKLHGALYNDAESDPTLAHRLCRFFTNQFGDYALLCLAGGEMSKAARKFPLKVISEGFIDRQYADATQLLARTVSGAVYSDLDQICQQALALAQKKEILCANGSGALIQADSLCLHGDRSDALLIAKQVSDTLSQAGVRLEACGS